MFLISLGSEYFLSLSPLNLEQKNNLVAVGECNARKKASTEPPAKSLIFTPALTKFQDLVDVLEIDNYFFLIIALFMV